MVIERPDDLTDIADLGLTLSEAKRLLATLQQEIVAAQVRTHAVRRPTCSRCGGGCRVKDYQDHLVATLFGQVTVRLPRFRCAACCGSESGVDWPSHCRSTPELDRLQAHLAAIMTYRTAADLLEQMFPVDAAKHPETVRRHALKVGEALGECATTPPEITASAVVVTVEFDLHPELQASGASSRGACRQCRNGIRWTAGIWLRRQSQHRHQSFDQPDLDAVGRTGETELTAFTDGCSGLRNILAAAGVTTAPLLDWFHIGMRLQHLKQVASGLSCDNPSREAAKAVIVEEVERLHWRLWNGKAKDAQISIDRIHAVMHHVKGEAGT
jgi:hypothetical protein